MKRIVQFSGGLASYFAAKRVVERHGAQDVILLFADTLIESDDLYRIMPTYVWATACRKVDDILKDGIDPIEQAFGNYVNEGDDLEFQQRYGIVTDPSKIKILKVPYAMRGQQGVWTWTPPEGLEFKEVCSYVSRETAHV